MSEKIIDMKSYQNVIDRCSRKKVDLTDDERSIGVEHLYRKHQRLSILVELTKNDLRALLDQQKKSKEELVIFIEKNGEE